MRQFLGALAMVVALAGPARADIANAPGEMFEIAAAFTGSASAPMWTTFWYVPDPSNALCPDGQWDMHGAHGALSSDGITEDAWDSCATGTMATFSQWYWDLAQPVGGVFRCPGDSFLYGGNCLTSVVSIFDPATAFEFFVSSFGLVVVCWMTAHGAAIVLKPLRK